MTADITSNVARSAELWHSLDLQAVADRLNTDLEHGLDAAEARKRLETLGPNEIKPVKSESAWEVFLELIREPLIVLLICIGILYSIWGGWQDALTILVIILIMVGAEVVTDYRSSQEIARLNKLAEPIAHVLRQSAEEAVPAGSVVPLETYW